jgi:phage gp46-like protein
MRPVQPSLYDSPEFMAWLHAAILQSFFTDRRAEPSEVAEPEAFGALRGWVGDLVAPVEGDKIGSKLWLLARRKQTERTRRDGETYARDALQWMIDDGWASKVDVVAAWQRRGVLGVRVVLNFNKAVVFKAYYEVKTGQ